MKLTIEQLHTEGYAHTTDVLHGIYILEDGNMWDGQIEPYSGRTVEHREVEVFTTLNRYDGNKFWDEIMLQLGLVLVEPENQMIYNHPQQSHTTAQLKVISELVAYGYEIMDWK